MREVMETEEIVAAEELLRATENFWDDPQNIMILLYLLQIYDEDPLKGC